ncbi:carbohydrate esterase family 16 protein [Cyathus striatus]|nr:carbohydrate esterase family 16 protein [Cyathus striatus]
MPSIYLLTALFLCLSSHVCSQRNDGIHLAVSPACGPLSGAVSDVNAGIDVKRIKTIVSFGDSYTDGGRDDGGPLAPPVLVPPNPQAGGRSTNGFTWIEHIANDMDATLKDYAQWGACVDLSLWPSNPRKVDFIGQMKTFLNQSNQLDPETTLYSIFFGINDYIASLTDGDHMESAAKALINRIDILSSPPTNARSILVVDNYGRGTVAESGETFKKTVFSALHELHYTAKKLDVAYVDFSGIWRGVLGPSPGYAAFGYRSTDACTVCNANGCTMDGMCDDPAGYFYWIPGHPSKQTMRIMADYVHEVLQSCRILD